VTSWCKTQALQCQIGFSFSFDFFFLEVILQTVVFWIETLCRFVGIYCCPTGTSGAHGSIVVKKLATSWKVAGSKPDEVNLSVYLTLLSALSPGEYSASNRNGYQKQKNYVSGE
jgi:hypothetical protein